MLTEQHVGVSLKGYSCSLTPIADQPITGQQFNAGSSVHMVKVIC